MFPFVRTAKFVLNSGKTHATPHEGPKAIVLVGPRQVGKTTLLEKLAQEHTNGTLGLNGDETDVCEMLTRTNKNIETFLLEA